MCAERGFTLNTHVGGAGGEIEYVGKHAQVMLYVDRSGWLSRRALPRLLFSGVFERHQALKLALTEQGGEWWSATMREYDSAYLSQEWLLKDQMPKRPSEYCMTNVFIGGATWLPSRQNWPWSRGMPATSCGGRTTPTPRARTSIPRFPTIRT
jgi:hypothetical protein